MERNEQRVLKPATLGGWSDSARPRRNLGRSRGVGCCNLGVADTTP